VSARSKARKQSLDLLYEGDIRGQAPADLLAIRERLPKDARCQVLAEPGRQYAVYFKGALRFNFALDLPAGTYQIQWLDVVSGRHDAPQKLAHPGGPAQLQIPDGFTECALRLVRVAN
jgi:hypothetical protein